LHFGSHEKIDNDRNNDNNNNNSGNNSNDDDDDNRNGDSNSNNNNSNEQTAPRGYLKISLFTLWLSRGSLLTTTKTTPDRAYLRAHSTASELACASQALFLRGSQRSSWTKIQLRGNPRTLSVSNTF